MTNKTLLAKRFAKSLETYNDNAKVQRIMANKLLTYLDCSKYNKILEIGCGTGLLTELCVNKLKFQKYTANDIVPECKNYITQILPQTEFLAGDIEECINKLDENYDLIISNAAFQWLNKFYPTVKLLVSKLTTNGILLFSTFGDRNFKEIFQITHKKLPYYSKDTLCNILSEFKPIIEEETCVLNFQTAHDILKHLKLTGVNAIEPVSWTKSDIVKFEKEYQKTCPTAPTLTYNPIYIKIYK